MMHIVSLFNPRVSLFFPFLHFLPSEHAFGHIRLQASSAGVILQSTSETSENGKAQSSSSEVVVSEPHSSPIAAAAQTKKVYSCFQLFRKNLFSFFWIPLNGKTQFFSFSSLS